MERSVPTLVLSGTIGAGKTAIATDIGEILRERGVTVAVLDLDWLGWLCRATEVDEDVEDLIIQNLKAVWPNFIAAGAERFVLARVLQSRAHVDSLSGAIPEADMRVVRLASPPELVERRLRARDSGAVLEEHLVETQRFAAELEEARAEDLIVTNDERPLREVSLELLASVDWI
jgi:gluconate kinase